MKKETFVTPDPKSWLEKFHFSIPIKVRYCETDMLGHVNNVSYFMYFEQGRIEYFENLQLADELFSKEKICVVADLECKYLAQIYLKDQLRLHIRAAQIGRSSIEIEYALVAADRLKAAGRGAIVLIETKTGKSTPISDEARQAIVAFERMDAVE
ncbi:acyl-CoA thioester hydrolase [Paenibacillus phyllosphaerae]|uniref:Acyl-CoA thioester hydrolase n=1 Tax=Paenibacillus phyllosphaerae TaxID=274593 RepID=A0A7W5FS79_9BACL|nr:thioesterase family protein [Paenibacillus phyllosphaerae]MBB3114764.1 acyl-CoA thioester hydrolase [Paenibacillus phyllosphaerae]